jgi:hypothetical protein
MSGGTLFFYQGKGMMSRPPIKTEALAHRIRRSLEAPWLVYPISVQRFKERTRLTGANRQLFAAALNLALPDSGYERKGRTLFKIVNLIVNPKPLEPLPIVALSEERVEEILAETTPWKLAVPAAPAPAKWMSPKDQRALYTGKVKTEPVMVEEVEEVEEVAEEVAEDWSHIESGADF